MATDKLLKLSQVSIIKQDSDDSYLGISAEAASAAKLGDSADAGSATQPVYFSGGVPAATTHTLAKSVPADAVFTDTTYSDVVADSATSGLMTGADKARLDGMADGAQANVLEGVTIGGSDAAITGKKVALGNAAAATIETTLTNGANLPTGAAVQSYVSGLGYQTASDVSGAISSALATVLDWKGAVDDMAALEAVESPKNGDVYHVSNSGSEYAYNGSAWEELGVTFDASGYVTAQDIVYATDDEVRTALGQSA